MTTSESPRPVTECATPDAELLPLADVLSLARTSHSTLRRWVEAGRFPAPLKWPGRRRPVWRASVVKEFLRGLEAVAS